MATKGSAEVRVGLAGWSLHRRFRRAESPLSLMEFPRLAREEFGISLIELNSPFFWFADEADAGASPIAGGYLERLRAAAAGADVRIVGIAVDHHGDLSSLDDDERERAVRQHAKWIEACQILGCDYFRANSGAKGVGPISRAHEQACARSFGGLAERAGARGVCVLMENHWGLSEDPERMVRVLRAVDNEFCGSLADFRNWPAGTDPYEALACIAPFAIAAHAKFLRFDDRGEDPDFDTARAVGILTAANFAGPYAIEFEGEVDDHEGVLLSRKLLIRHLRALRA